MLVERRLLGRIAHVLTYAFDQLANLPKIHVEFTSSFRMTRALHENQSSSKNRFLSVWTASPSTIQADDQCSEFFRRHLGALKFWSDHLYQLGYLLRPECRLNQSCHSFKLLRLYRTHCASPLKNYLQPSLGFGYDPPRSPKSPARNMVKQRTEGLAGLSVHLSYSPSLCCGLRAAFPIFTSSRSSGFLSSNHFRHPARTFQARFCLFG